MIRRYEEVVIEETIICSHLISILIYYFINVKIIDYQNKNNTEEKLSSILNRCVFNLGKEEVILECIISDENVLSLTRYIDEEQELSRYNFYFMINEGSIYNKINPILIIKSNEADGLDKILKDILFIVNIDIDTCKEHIVSFYEYLEKNKIWKY